MRRSGYFVVGALMGAIGVLVFERVRDRYDSYESDRLSRRVTEYLGQLEARLEKTLHEKEGDSA